MSTATNSHRASANAIPIAADLERIRLEYRAQRIELVLARLRHRSSPAAHQSAGRLVDELALELQAIQERLGDLSAEAWD